MRLLLTSTGLSTANIVNAFLSQVIKPRNEIRVLFIPTAALTKEELYYTEVSKKELEDLGIKDIKVLDLNKNYKYDDIRNYDVMYVCGGNTFYLLTKIRETGFNDLIKEFILDNKLYFGVSAGSIIVCPNIDICSPFDENVTNIQDLNALNIIDFFISPHYTESEKPILEKVMKKYPNLRLVTLTDTQALLITDIEKKLIE